MIRLVVDNSKPVKTVVRTATPEDITAIWDMLVNEMYPETGIASLDHDKATQVIVEVFTSGYVLVADKGGEIVGSVGLMVGEPFWYSRDVSVYDRWTYVKPEHRGKTFALLIRAAEQYAAQRSLPFTTAVHSTKDTDRKNRLFRRKGFVPIGEVLVKGFDQCVSETSSAGAAAVGEAEPKP